MKDKEQLQAMSFQELLCEQSQALIQLDYEYLMAITEQLHIRLAHLEDVDVTPTDLQTIKDLKSILKANNKLANSALSQLRQYAAILTDQAGDYGKNKKLYRKGLLRKRVV